jgi:membrane fusion protein (multidrug efflux system)
MKRKIIKAILAGIVILGVLVAVRGISISQSQKEPATAPPPIKKAAEVRVVSAARSGIARALDLTGSVKPYRVAQVASPAEGPVMNLRVWEGDRVQGGDLLLSVGRKKGIDAQIVALREDLKKEEDNFKRIQTLIQADALPGEQLDLARSNLEKAKSQLIKAEETMGDFSVVAPWAGVVSRVKVRDGDFVGPRAPLIEIYDPRSLVIRVAVPEAFAAHIRNEMPIQVTLDAFSNAVFKARVVRLYPYLDARTRTRTLEAKVTDPVDLLPGMFARLKLQLESVADAVVVPIEAVIITPRGKRVAFVASEGKAARREVVTGIEEGGNVQIIEGISAGEAVVVSGNEKLTDGTEIQVRGGGPQ